MSGTCVRMQQGAGLWFGPTATGQRTGSGTGVFNGVRAPHTLPSQPDQKSGTDILLLSKRMQSFAFPSATGVCFSRVWDAAPAFNRFSPWPGYDTMPCGTLLP